MIPEKIQAKWDEIHAELQRRLEALWERKAQGFQLRSVIHGEAGIVKRVEWSEKDRKQSEKHLT